MKELYQDTSLDGGEIYMRYAREERRVVN